MDRDQARDYRRRCARAARMLEDRSLVAHIARLERTIHEETPPAGALALPLGSPDRLRRVGALAGSFNPLTAAHVALGAAGRAAGHLDGIIWVISAVTVNKERVERATVVDRLIQMVARVEGSSDGCALINGGLYVEQARVLRGLLPQVDELALIVGYDKVEQIFDRRYYENRDAALEELFGLATLLVSPRGDGDVASLHALLRREENQRYARFVVSVETPERYRWDSSSKVRALLNDGSGGRATRAQIRTLLAPEGMALARLPGVYGTTETKHASEAPEDAYVARQRMIAELAEVGGANETH